MTRPPLTSILLRSVSTGALHYGVEAAACPRAHSDKLERDTALGFLGRVKLWLRIIFNGFVAGQMQVQPISHLRRAGPNRKKTRLRKRVLPLARTGDLLAHHIMRRYGRARFLDWIYNHTLTPRFRWCFTAWNWAWRPRMSFAHCDMTHSCHVSCPAILTPD